MSFEFDKGKEELIRDYVDCDFDDYNCKDCSFKEDCYMQAIANCNYEFAKSIDYGGYDTEEEFWDNL